MSRDERLVRRAKEAAHVLAPLARVTESSRRLPPEAVQALVDAGVFKLHVPEVHGGAEASLATAIAVLEEIGHADGSAGWCAMIGSTSSLMSAFLEEGVARSIYGARDAMTSGVFAPMGRARRTAGGFVVSGRWSFASGCEHAAWRMGGATIVGEEPGLLPSGAPNVQCMLFPAAEMRVIDTWDTSGLRGTGSHDVEVTDVFVPDSHSFSLLRDAPRHPGRLYRLPFFGILAASIAAVALGIAQSSIDELVVLLKTKIAPGQKRALSHRELLQLDVARAEAKLGSARAYLREAVAAVEETNEITLPLRARLRLAACHATTEAAAAVDLMYNAGGAGSVYSVSPLQRHFRDVHVATQHVMVGQSVAVLAGRILLGVEANTDLL